MSERVKGVVGPTSSKDWTGRNGTVTLYSFKLEGGDTWYRCGTEKPSFNQGDSITFECETKGNNVTVVPNSVVKTEAAKAQRGPAVSAKGAVKENWDARAAYWDAKERREIDVVEPRITLSASRTAAIGVVGLALAHDAIPFGNVGKGAKLGIILDAIDEITARYYKQSMGGAPVETPETTEEEVYDDELSD